MRGTLYREYLLPGEKVVERRWLNAGKVKVQKAGKGMLHLKVLEEGEDFRWKGKKVDLYRHNARIKLVWEKGSAETGGR